MIFDKNIRGILLPVLILIGIGGLMVYSSTAFVSAGKYGNGFHYFLRHIFTVIIGFVVMISLARLDYHKLRGFVIPLLILSIILLVLVFIPGIGVSAGAKSSVKRWIRLWPSTFQPSEFVKIALILFLSDYMSKYADKMKGLRYGILIPVGVMCVFQGIILLQPDFGAVMSIGIIMISLLFIGGANWRYIAGVVLAAIPSVVVLILIAPYRMKRIVAFLDPWEDPKGKGYQLIQSFLALGRGGITGVGIGNSKQKLFFLPESHTDFIFSLIGEELGLIGVLCVVSIFIFLFIKGMKIAMQAEDLFGYYLASGLIIMIVTQALINFAVTTGVMPTKGLPLPFISYGGSALLINMSAVGILMNIASATGHNINLRFRDSRTVYGLRL